MGPTPRTARALALFQGLPPLRPGGAVLSFGQDPRWRRAMVRGPRRRRRARARRGDRHRPGRPRRSRAATAARSSGSTRARRCWRAAGAGARSVGPERGRSSPGEAERLPFADGEFDALTFTYLLRYVDDPAATLRELARVVRPGGAHRDARVRRAGVAGAAVGRVHARRAAGPRPARLPRWYEVGRFLGPSIDDFSERHPLSALVELWRAAGIGSVASGG